MDKGYKWNQMEVSAICLIVKAFREIYDNDKTYYNTIDFCNTLNMRPFENITIKQIKELIPKISIGGLITEDHLNKGYYRWNEGVSKGLTNL